MVKGNSKQLPIDQSYGERQLLDGFISGEGSAFEQIYATYFSRIYVFARKIIDNNEEAKDIAINVFAKLFSKHKDFDNIPEIRGFLYTSVRNACYNYLKQLQRKTAQQQQILVHLLSEEPAVEQTEGEVIAAIYRALQQLPLKSRKVLELLYLEGKKYSEVASIMNISVETVKSQRYYSIKKLREILANHPLFITLLTHALLVLKK